MNQSGRETLGKKVTYGAGLLMLFRLADRLIGLASFAVLARLLVPEDFGLFTLAISFLTIIELFGHAGLDLALIQRREAGRTEYDTAWTIGVIVGIAIAVIATGSAMVASSVIEDPRVGAILYWLALASFLGGFSNVGTVDFQKHFDFGKEFRFRLFVRLIRTAITILCAVVWQDVWALVAGYVAGTFVRVVLSYLMHPYRPRLALGAARSFLRFSGWVLLRNIFTGLGDRATNLILGLYVNAAALGYFTAGRTIADLATTELQAPIRRALFPSLAALSNDLAALRLHYVSAIGLIALICIPIPAGVILIANDIVLILLGETWLPAVPLIQILALAGILRCFFSGAQFLLIALDQPRTAAWLAAIRLSILLPIVTFATIMAGAVGTAWAIVAVAGVMLVVNVIFMLRATGLGLRVLFSVTHRPVAAAIAMAVGVWNINVYWAPATADIGALGHLMILSLPGAAIYVGTVLACWALAGRPAGAERHALDFLAEKIWRFRPAI